ncbi:hypothetical protein ESCO_006112 [Escovopsis weberi]|uniref:Uncharacterized protein n=1 Tax=Escovopsis weberi TaxID=150374 RepID=A0A0M8N5F2_ESCWE|nr:hypothetical protein ESCO_006112 [Escovopsis weberi]
MESMSGFITILENFNDLEVSIIRATKINKVLKAILKLETIPHEEEFGFKKRSQALLDKWNKLLASDGSAAPAAGATAPANGVNGSTEANAAEKDKEAEKEKEKEKETQSGANGADDDAKPEAEKAMGDAAASTKAKAEEEKPKDDDEAGKEKEKVDEEMVY